MATYCQHCGAEIKNGQQYCTNCGEPVPAKTATQANNQQAQTGDAQQMCCYQSPYGAFPYPVALPYGGMNPYCNPYCNPYANPYAMMSPYGSPYFMPYAPVMCPFASQQLNEVKKDDTMSLLDVHGTLPSENEEETEEEEVAIEGEEDEYGEYEDGEYEEEEETAKKRNGFSIAGFVLSFFGPLAILGLIFSIVGVCKSKKLGSGRGLGIAGIVISVLWLVALVGGVALLFIPGLPFMDMFADWYYAVYDAVTGLIS